MASQVTVRTWDKRKDRRAIGRWPKPTIPAHWVATSHQGRSVSWAVDAEVNHRGMLLVGRISLRDFRGVYSARLGMYLHPDYYGQGIGTAALRQFLRIAPVYVILLDVAPDNHRALGCYRNAGFAYMDMPGEPNVYMHAYTDIGTQFYHPEGPYASVRAALYHIAGGVVDR
jgi:RimJ/RimL family protein N-acetyltransferase